MSFAVIIPARMHSTRLPNKPLMDIAGKPMVVRVAERAALSGASRVAVATDHDDIVKACTENGIEAVLTKETHPTGTDRLSEAATLMGLADDTIVVNVWGALRKRLKRRLTVRLPRPRTRLRRSRSF